MAKKDEIEDELADFDPEAPPENPPDELAIERSQNTKKTLLVVVLVAAALFVVGHAIFGGKGSGRTYRRELASTVVDLQGREVTTIPAPLEGPYVFVEPKNGQQVVLSKLGGGTPETFTLAGIDGTLDAAKFSETGAASVDPTRAARIEKFKSIEPTTMEAVKELCGVKPIYVLRMTPASPASPSKAFLLQPRSELANPKDPMGLATLINAQLIRDGKAILKLEQQPFLDPPMIDCELAAIVDLSHAQQKGEKVDSVWTQFTPPVQDIPNYNARMAAINRVIR